MEDGNKTKVTRLTKRWAIVVGVVIVCFIGMVVFWPREKEPEYQGKKLSEWLEICRTFRQPRFGGPVPREEPYEDAVKAVQQIGTNGLPLLVRWLDVEAATSGHAYRFAQRLPTALQRQKLISRYLSRPWTRLDAAAIGFEILGTQALGAIPALAQFIQQPTAGRTSRIAASLLFRLGEPMSRAGHAVLRDALGNPKADRVTIARMVADNRYFGSETGLWVGALDRCVAGDDQLVAVESVKALQAIGEWGAYYINEIHNGDHFYGWGSPYKTNVVPALKGALGSPSLSVRTAATNALLSVAPEVLLSEWQLREREARGEVPGRVSFGGGHE